MCFFIIYTLINSMNKSSINVLTTIIYCELDSKNPINMYNPLSMDAFDLIVTLSHFEMSLILKIYRRQETYTVTKIISFWKQRAFINSEKIISRQETNVILTNNESWLAFKPVQVVIYCKQRKVQKTHRKRCGEPPVYRVCLYLRDQW